jgi:hypothetical protein
VHARCALAAGRPHAFRIGPGRPASTGHKSHKINVIPASISQLLRVEKEVQMRIQETDRILKESRYMRNAHASSQHEDEGTMSKLWRSVASLPGRVSGIFKRNR